MQLVIELVILLIPTPEMTPVSAKCTKKEYGAFLRSYTEIWTDLRTE